MILTKIQQSVLQQLKEDKVFMYDTSKASKRTLNSLLDKDLVQINTYGNGDHWELTNAGDEELKQIERLNDLINDKNDSHKVWHKFSKWLGKTFGSDLWGEEQVMEYKDQKGKTKKIKYKHFNEHELSQRLVGYEVMEKIEKYIKRSCPEIKIVRCDDSVYAGSDILLIPHPMHGIRIMYIPQCTNIQNEFFLYKGHYTELMKALKEMSHVYKGIKWYKKKK